METNFFLKKKLNVKKLFPGKNLKFLINDIKTLEKLIKMILLF